MKTNIPHTCCLMAKLLSGCILSKRSKYFGHKPELQQRCGFKKWILLIWKIANSKIIRIVWNPTSCRFRNLTWKNSIDHNPPKHGRFRTSMCHTHFENKDDEEDHGENVYIIIMTSHAREWHKFSYNRQHYVVGIYWSNVIQVLN